MAKKRARAAQSSAASGRRRKRQKRDIKTGRFVSRAPDTVTTPTNHRATLLSLPREIRNNIYTYMGPSKDPNRTEFLFSSLKCHCFVDIVVSQQFTPVLRLVNKQIHDEYTQEYCRFLTIYVFPMWICEGKEARGFCRRVLDATHPLLRVVERCTIVQYDTPSWWDSPDERPTTRMLGRITQLMPNVKDLTIRVAVIHLPVPSQGPMEAPHKRSDVLRFMRFRPPTIHNRFKERCLVRLEKVIRSTDGVEFFRRVEESVDGARRPVVRDWLHPVFAEVLARLRWKIGRAHETALLV